MSRIVFVGGGISGLVAALRTEQYLPGADVVLLEQQPQVGGKVGTLERDGFRVETGPNGFLDNKPAVLNLCRELGLADRLIPASEASGRNRYLFLRGRMRSLPTGLGSFLASDVLGVSGKLGLLLERFRPRRRTTADESIHDFARRRVGREVAETLADAFVTGIYAGDPKCLSLAACFPRLAAFEREHGSVMAGFAAARRQRRAEAAARGEAPPGGQRMWSFREGLGLLIDTLRASLRRPPVVGVNVRWVRRARDAGNWQVRADGDDHWNADAVVLACPSNRQAELLADEDRELARDLAEIAYTPVAVVALGYRAADLPGRLDGFGYLTPQRDRRDALGVQWCSSIFPGRAPEGTVLLRALCGGWNRQDILGWDEERLLSAVRNELAVTMRVRAAPVFHHVVRWDRAIPQYHVGHLARVERIEKRAGMHPGLYLGGNSFRGVALNDCVEQAELLAQRLRAELPATSIRELGASPAGSGAFFGAPAGPVGDAPGGPHPGR
jgi:oxygen-dependent protoporphyrinogen oxidase